MCDCADKQHEEISQTAFEAAGDLLHWCNETGQHFTPRASEYALLEKIARLWGCCPPERDGVDSQREA